MVFLISYDFIFAVQRDAYSVQFVVSFYYISGMITPVDLVNKVFFY